MTIAELLSLREQIAAENDNDEDAAYDPQHRSLANTMRALRKCMRNLHKYSTAPDGLFYNLAQALVQRYNNRTRYRPKNPDKKEALPHRQPPVSNARAARSP